METAEKLFERAKRLKGEELSRLVGLLQKHLSSQIKAEYSLGEEHYSELLALSGIGDSDYTDVSSDKAKNLAQAYAPRRGDLTSDSLIVPKNSV